MSNDKSSTHNESTQLQNKEIEISAEIAEIINELPEEKKQTIIKALSIKKVIQDHCQMAKA